MGNTWNTCSKYEYLVKIYSYKHPKHAAQTWWTKKWVARWSRCCRFGIPGDRWSFPTDGIPWDKLRNIFEAMDDRMTIQVVKKEMVSICSSWLFSHSKSQFSGLVAWFKKNTGWQWPMTPLAAWCLGCLGWSVQVSVLHFSWTNDARHGSELQDVPVISW